MIRREGLDDILYPAPRENTVYVDASGVHSGYDDPEQWVEDRDRNALTIETPRVDPFADSDTEPEHESAQTNTPALVRFGPVKSAPQAGPARWPGPRQAEKEAEPWWVAPVRVVKRVGMVAVLLVTGAAALKGAEMASSIINTTQPQANIAPYYPPTQTPSGAKNTAPTPTTQPTPKVTQPTPTPNQQPPTPTPPNPTPTPQPPAPTPTPKTGPQPEYVTKSDGNLQAGDTVFATCRSGSGANETYTVNGQRYSSSDFQNTNDANLPQC